MDLDKERNNTGYWHLNRSLAMGATNDSQRALRIVLTLSLPDLRRDG